MFYLLICLLYPALVTSLGLEVLTNELQLKMGETGAVVVKLTGRPMSYEEQATVDILIADNSSHVMESQEKSILFTRDDIWISENATREIVFEGKLLGIGVVEFSINGKVAGSAEITVTSNNKVLGSIFLAIMTAMIIVNTINMGAQLDLEIVKEVMKKPVGPIVGFICQFLFMPGFSFLIGYLYTDDKLFRLGLFVLGCCPGGNGSNFWTLLLGGDINLSIVMTFVSTIAALGMMPLWIFLVAPFLSEGSLRIPFQQLISSLVGLILPIAFGIFIRWKWLKLAKKLEKIIVPFTLLTVIFILTAGVYINLFIFQLMTGTMVAAGFTVAFVGYLFGAGFAWLFRLKKEQIIAVSIETSFQNGSIAFVLLQISFPEPLGELASVAPVAQLLLTGLPLWLVFFAIKLYKCYRSKKYGEVPTQEKVSANERGELQLEEKDDK